MVKNVITRKIQDLRLGPRVKRKSTVQKNQRLETVCKENRKEKRDVLEVRKLFMTSPFDVLRGVKPKQTTKLQCVKTLFTMSLLHRKNHVV